jgi:Zn-dependent protease
MSEPLNSVQLFAILVIPVLVAITFHEAAHGFVALRFGDDTAKKAGRLTFNPLKHIDPIGTVMVPILLFALTQGGAMFGWAKPVPVNFRKLRRPRLDGILVALAGPGINLVLALLSALLLSGVLLLPETMQEWAGATLIKSTQLNVVLAIFNLLPIPPLDGGRVVLGLLPKRLAQSFEGLERVGLLLVLTALVFLPYLGQMLGVNLNFFTWLVRGPTQYILEGIAALTGLGVAS